MYVPGPIPIGRMGQKRSRLTVFPWTSVIIMSGCVEGEGGEGGGGGL